MRHTIKAKKADVKPLLKVTFPEYRGRKFKVEFTDKVTFYDTNWGGGTRNEYAFVKNTGENVFLDVPAPWENAYEGQTVEMRQDVYVVCHTIFCGSDLGITVYSHPDNMPKWIEA